MLILYSLRVKNFGEMHIFSVLVASQHTKVTLVFAKFNLSGTYPTMLAVSRSGKSYQRVC